MNELIKIWDSKGRPKDAKSISEILKEYGVDDLSVGKIFQKIGVILPPEAPKVSTPTNKVTLDTSIIPIDYEITSNTGKTYVWKGAQWTCKGRIVPKEFKDKISSVAIERVKKDIQDKKDEIAKNYEFGESNIEQKLPQDTISNNTSTANHQQFAPTDQKEKIFLALANQAKQSNTAEKVANLLAMKDKLADFAASIILSGNADAVVNALYDK